MPTTTAQLSAPLADSGTVTFSYPSGTSAGSFASTSGHVLSYRGTKFFSPTEFTVSFGASNITVTYLGGEVLPKATVLTLSLNAVEDAGDAIVVDLNDGAGRKALDTILRAMGGNTLGVRRFLATDDSVQAEIGEVLGAVNRVRLQPAITTQGPSISAQGSDTNIDLNYAAKGTGSHVFGNGSGTLLEIEDVGAVPANVFSIRPAATGARPRIASNHGADYEVATGNVHNFTVAGEVCFRVARSGTGAVNYLQMEGSSSLARMIAVGDSTDISIYAQPKGAGSYIIQNTSGRIATFDSGGSSTSRVNNLYFRNAATGAPPEIRAQGSDTNVDLSLVPQGTGVLRFGTHSAIASETVTGFITVKDSGGTTRKLAVVS